MMRVLIIDDEPVARQKVRDHLARHADMVVVGECRDLDEARAAMVSLRPDLIFLDLRLPGGHGLSFLRSLGANRPICILVTAISDCALEAYELEAVDYLLKPFDDRRFSRSLDRARALSSARRKGRAELAAGGSDPEPRLAIPDNNGVRLVRASQIDWIQAEGNYAALHIGNRRHLVRATIHKLAETLPQQHFLQVSRSAIVNLDQIERLEPWISRREYIIVLSSGSRVKLSRNYRKSLEERVPRLA
jgi:two-component system LytT family response regulator